MPTYYMERGNVRALRIVDHGDGDVWVTITTDYGTSVRWKITGKVAQDIARTPFLAEDTVLAGLYGVLTAGRRAWLSRLLGGRPGGGDGDQ